jgi:RimJ/RimL family protein N-acetyltransferase
MIELPRDPIMGDSIVLRQFEDTDIDDMVTAVNDPETQRFPQGLPSPYKRYEAARWALRRVPEAWAVGGGHHFAIGDPATGRLLGSIGLGPTQLGGHAAGVGYWVAPWARRRGVATKAARTLASWAFAHGFGRLELTTDLANEGSQRVALSAGFQHEGIRRAVGKPGDGQWRDLVVWSRLATDSGDPVPRALPDIAGTLTDGVVTVRPLRADDADDLLALASLPEVIATSVGDVEPTPAWAARRCSMVGYLWLIGSRITFAICDAETGAFAGDIGLFHEGQTGQAMIGYSVAPEWRGRSFAARAARLVADWALDEAGIARVVAGAAPDYGASRRTLEKAGFIYEGIERSRLPGRDGGARIDDVVYALLPSDRKPLSW